MSVFSRTLHSFESSLLIDSTANSGTHTELRTLIDQSCRLEITILQMEEFTRECLEIDTEAETSGTPSLLQTVSMDKVYERAAKLVKRTLDVEGAIVMDVSHVAVVESVKAEGSISVVMHNGDPQSSTSSYSISTEDYSRFLEFFMRNPEGKVVEGIMPRCFRTLLPTRVQHALRECNLVPLTNGSKK